MKAKDARLTMTLLINAYRRSQCLRVAAELKIPELLAAGPRTAADLAAECGAHEPSLRRLLRTLVAMEVLAEDPPGSFGTTGLGEELRGDQLGPAARLFNSPLYWNAWLNLEHSVRTGERAFDFVYGMRDWDYYATHPEDGALFDAVMSSHTNPVAARIADAYDFSQFPVLVDVGGGDGTLIAAVLRRHPNIRGVVFDRPDVVERARVRMAAAGMGDRCDFVGGDFMRQVPEGAGAYLMKHIIHDWSDSEATRILQRCLAAATDSGAHVLVIERVLPERIGPDDLEALTADLNMMVMPGGLERTESEFRRLFEGAGLRLRRVVPTGTHVHILDAVPR